MSELSEPNGAVDKTAREVIGAAIEVHRYLGPGLLESVYEQSLATELELRAIRFERQKLVDVIYKSRRVGQLRLDLVVEGNVIVELKSVEAFADIHFAQVSSYLRATRLPLGLLLNFNTKQLKHGIRRVIRRSDRNELGELGVGAGELGDR